MQKVFQPAQKDKRASQESDCHFVWDSYTTQRMSKPALPMLVVFNSEKEPTLNVVYLH